MKTLFAKNAEEFNLTLATVRKDQTKSAGGFTLLLLLQQLRIDPEKWKAIDGRINLIDFWFSGF